MQSELKKDEIIVEVVCAGPKNYAYKTYNSTTGESKTVCKVRDITLNYSASQLVNFEKKKDMILKEGRRKSYHAYRDKDQTQKDRRRCNLISEPEDKTYRVSFLKRTRLTDNT